MATRTYDMRKRARSAEATRQRIIEAAHELLGRPDGGSLALHEVAEAAGVTRATIYNRVGTRADLLTAVFVDQGRLIEFDRVLNAMAREDPRRAVFETVRESCRAWDVIPVAIRRTLALAVIDPEVGHLVTRFERSRRGRIGALALRAERAGALASGVSGPEAQATLSLLTGFQAFDHLRLEHDSAECAAILGRAASLLLDEPYLPPTGT